MICQRAVGFRESRKRCLASEAKRRTDPEQEAARKGIGEGHLRRSVEENEPGSDWQEWEEELSSDRYDERGQQQRGHYGLDQGPGRLDDTQGEDANDCEQQVLPIIQGPPM